MKKVKYIVANVHHKTTAVWIDNSLLEDVDKQIKIIKEILKDIKIDPNKNYISGWKEIHVSLKSTIEILENFRNETK